MLSSHDQFSETVRQKSSVIRNVRITCGSICSIADTRSGQTTQLSLRRRPQRSSPFSPRLYAHARSVLRGRKVGRSESDSGKLHGTILNGLNSPGLFFVCRFPNKTTVAPIACARPFGFPRQKPFFRPEALSILCECVGRHRPRTKYLCGLIDSGLYHDVSNFGHSLLFHALSASSANSAPMALGWNSLISDCQPRECH